MRQRYDLAGLEWTLTGWHPHYWEFPGMKPDVRPVPARVPGSVQQSLLDAGLLPDWNVQLNSRLAEWVENRHWTFEVVLPDIKLPAGARVRLVCEGLDYQGVVRLGGKEAGRFKGSLVPHTFDLTALWGGDDRRLTIAFTHLPRYLGQIGYTSRIRDWKPRYNYIWDWVIRLVQVGIWDGLRLEVTAGDAIEHLRMYTDYDHQSGLGSLAVQAGLTVAGAASVEVVVSGAAGQVMREVFPPQADFRCTLAGLPVEAWQPNGNGPQPLYTATVSLLGPEGTVLDADSRPIGFRQVAWRPCQGAPEEAEPWLCEINGRPTFLQGANWVPPLANFADVTEPMYRQRLELYRDLGCNLLRVWGGSIPEREVFYNLCDEMGILVWQEFPLSSSGIDNWPPEDEQAVSEYRAIAESYIARRQHHPSLLMWCGGNELLGGADGGKVGMERPLDNSHPMLAAGRDAVRRLDPSRRYVPTSPSGPRAGVNPAEAGQGLHHDVHGPWNHVGDLAGWRAFWDADDALFHSEIGMPGAESVDLLRRYGGDMALPADATNPWWTHTAGWWLQDEDYRREGGDPADLEAFVAWSQQRQAEALAYAARACKRRFPACGGFVLWMGHDCYPCPANTAIIDFEGRPKPAALAVARVFRGEDV